MKSIKVLHVVAGMNPELGGVSKAVRMIMAGLSDLNISSEVVTIDSPDAPYLENDTFPIHAVGVGKTPWSYNPNLLKWLEADIERFDIVIVHGLWLYTSYVVRRVVSLLRNKNRIAPGFFVMPHGMLDPYFQKAPGRRLKAMRNWIFWKVIERKVLQEANGILFTCEMEKILAKKTFTPYQPKKELVVGLGVENPPVFSEAMREAFKIKTDFNTNLPYLLYIGRIHEKKGIDILINAYLNLKLLNTILPLLVIAGPGIETEYGRRHIQQLASKSSDIRFVGMLTGDAKWGAFYGCEAFVLPSHQENFGIAVAEALACGKPVLISNQVNIWKEIADSGAGLVADDKESKIQEMLADWLHLSNDEKKIMGVRAKSCFENHFAINAASHRLVEALTH